MAILYGIGVGPGDPGLMTIKAARLVKDVLASGGVVFAPAAKAGARSLAAEIAAGAGLASEAGPGGSLAESLVELDFPMTRDSGELERAWREAAAPVVAVLDEGRDAAFLTLGDPGVYSTWGYLRAAVLALRPDAALETVPGVMAMNAAAARLGRCLVEGGERLALVPLPERLEELDAFLGLVDTLAVYKIAGRLGALADWAEARGLEAGLVVGAGLGRERAGPLVTLARAGAEGYLSAAIVSTGRARASIGGGQP